MSLTPQGFARPSFDEIRGAIIERMREIYGPINIGAESAIGQQISIMAERENSLWEAQEAVYLNQYPASAGGRSLDGAVQLTGISRLGATRSIATVTIFGVSGTTIPAGSLIANDTGGEFELVTDVLIPPSGEIDAQARAVDAGATLALAGTLTNIVTPVSGWDSVINLTDGDVGRDTETDPQLRIRQQQSLSITGAATVPAIRSRLLDQVTDVTGVTIIENRSNVTDSAGRPPHSFETIVQGGLDQEIADLLWQVKPAGIETFGNVEMIVDDTEGEQHPIRFSRAEQVFVWVRVTLTPNGVGTFPPEPESAVKAAVVEYGETLGVGDKVLFQAFYGGIYDVIPGMQELLVELAVGDAFTQPASGDYAAANIAVASNEVALFLDDRVEVIIND